MPKAKKKKRSAARSRYTAATADRHELYQLSVQNVEAEIDFVDKTYRKLRGRHAVRLREDFCGTGNTSCEWVRRRRSNIAVGLDIDGPTLDWGRRHNIAALKEDQRARVSLLQRDVREPGDAVGMDAVLAMNFSYWLFRERRDLLAYFRKVRESLSDDGIFFLDHYGGSEAMTEMAETRRQSGFTYVWDQAKFNPITGDFRCHIHFRFPDKTEMKRAFSYTWRLWVLPEIRDLLEEAGFRRVTVYWEGDDGDGGGNGVFRPRKKGDADPAFIVYLVAEK